MDIEEIIADVIEKRKLGRKKWSIRILPIILKLKNDNYTFIDISEYLNKKGLDISRNFVYKIYYENTNKKSIPDQIHNISKDKREVSNDIEIEAKTIQDKFNKLIKTKQPEENNPYWD